ncbi:MAG: hypothetical protein MI921_00875 [Cytophagales bacterium]|nr:hypothetical protein [Cytophagales bacterium]
MRFFEVVIMLGLFIYHLGFVFKANDPKWVLLPGVVMLMMLLGLFMQIFVMSHAGRGWGQR